MKNLLLLTILISTIACNGSGGGPIKVDPETNQIVETLEVWSHDLEDCEAKEETPTLRYECVDKGLKPLSASWEGLSDFIGLPDFKIDNGVVKVRQDSPSSGYSYGNFYVIDLVNKEFSIEYIQTGSKVLDWLNNTNLESGGLTTLMLTGRIERQASGTLKMITETVHKVKESQVADEANIETDLTHLITTTPIWILE